MIKRSLCVIFLLEMVFGAVVFDENANATTVSLDSRFNLVSMWERNNTSDVHVLTLEKHKGERLTNYALGYIYTGDLLLGQISDTLSYYYNKDFEVTLDFPGIPGTVISSIVIYVTQTSKIGGSYIVSGGIGENYAKIVIEAKQTSYLSYWAAVFGRQALNK